MGYNYRIWNHCICIYSSSFHSFNANKNKIQNMLRQSALYQMTYCFTSFFCQSSEKWEAFIQPDPVGKFALGIKICSAGNFSIEVQQPAAQNLSSFYIACYPYFGFLQVPALRTCPVSLTRDRSFLQSFLNFLNSWSPCSLVLTHIGLYSIEEAVEQRCVLVKI